MLRSGRYNTAPAATRLFGMLLAHYYDRRDKPDLPQNSGLMLATVTC